MYSLALEIQNQLIGLNHSLDKFVKHNFIGDENSVEELESIIDSPWYNYFQLHVDIAYAFMHLVFTGFPLADETFRVLFGYLEEEHLNKLPDAIESEDISDVQASTAADERPRRESYCERITNLCCSFLRTKSNQERTPLLDTASTTSSSDLEEGESKGCCKSRGPSICILS